MKSPLNILWILALASLLSGAAVAQGLELQRVTEGVYAIVGELENRSAENSGNNATFGFVVTTAGVVLIDSGGTRKGAQQIHNVIKSVTDKPVKIVINTGGQDHRWLGNEYFKQQGARIIANQRAVEDQKTREHDQFFMLSNLVGEAGLEGTNAVFADESFDQKMTFTLGETLFELHYAAHAHTQGDSYVWLPKERVVFTGDIVFVERMLGILEVSKSRSWMQAFDAVAKLNPQFVVPGHGHVTTLAQAKADTYDYLSSVRAAVAAFMKQGGNAADISEVDQSRFSYLKSYDVLKGRNALKVFTELEWE